MSNRGTHVEDASPLKKKTGCLMNRAKHFYLTRHRGGPLMSQGYTRFHRTGPRSNFSPAAGMDTPRDARQLAEGKRSGALTRLMGLLEQSAP